MRRALTGLLIGVTLGAGCGTDRAPTTAPAYAPAVAPEESVEELSVAEPPDGDAPDGAAPEPVVEASSDPEPDVSLEADLHPPQDERYRPGAGRGRRCRILSFADESDRTPVEETVYEFDANGRLVRYSYENDAAAHAMRERRTLDADGRVTQMRVEVLEGIDGPGVEEVRFEHALVDGKRVVRELVDGDLPLVTRTHEVDSDGRLVSRVEERLEVGETVHTTCHYEDGRRFPVSIGGGAMTKHYSYDDDGNLVGYVVTERRDRTAVIVRRTSRGFSSRAEDDPGRTEFIGNCADVFFAPCLGAFVPVPPP